MFDVAKTMIKRLEEKSCALLVVDLQEHFVPVISSWEETVKASSA